MIVYNLTELSPGVTTVAGVVDIVVWAMGSQGDFLHRVSVHAGGIFYELEREAPGSSTVPPPKGPGIALEERYLYRKQLALKPGTHRIRIVCEEVPDKPQWLYGFTVRVASSRKTQKPGKTVSLNVFEALSLKLKSGALEVFARILARALERIWSFRYGPNCWRIFRLVNPERLGHLAANTEIFLAETACRLHGPLNIRSIFYISKFCLVEGHGWVDSGKRVANRCLLDYWQRQHPVVREGFVPERCLGLMEARSPGIIFHDRPHGHRDIHGCLDSVPPSVALDGGLLTEGSKRLETLGVPAGARLVLVHFRSAAFVAETYKDLGNTLEDQRYGYRNVRSSHYDPAIEHLAAQGFYVLRVGTEKNPWQSPHPRAIDYASRRTDDWMDLYLFHRCEFFCGTTSGIYALADLFRKPIVFTNFAPLGHVYSWSPRHLTIFKRLVHQDTREVVPVSRLLGCELGWTIHWEKIKDKGLAYVDNSPEEIRDAVAEMADRIEGRWEEDPEDVRLQEAFWKQIPTGEFHVHKNSRIGSRFLRDNRDWLLS